MPTALERLFASPSALRTLRCIVNGPELPAIWVPAIHCCHSAGSKRRLNTSATPKPKSKLETRGSPSLVRLSKPAPKFDFNHESAVNSPAGPQPRKVDDPNEPNKIQVWIDLLQYQYRTRGDAGIRYIWYGMMKRQVELPANTEEGGKLWGIFIRNRSIVPLVLDHAIDMYRSTGRFYAGLYEDCVGYWLTRRPQLAYACHTKLVKHLRLRKLPLRRLASVAVAHPRALGMFWKIYTPSRERDVYDSIIPALCDRGQVELARTWHIHCVQRKDLPSDESRAHPMVRQFTKEYQVFASGSKTLRISNDKNSSSDVDLVIRKYTDESGVPILERYDRDLMRRMTGRRVEQVRYDDKFCARLFATRAFPLSAIINGLRMLKVGEIGPQSLRELALRADPLSELSSYYRQLASAGVSVRSCVFTLAVEKFTTEKNFELVRSLVESDQHFSVLEDADTQAKLLDYYITQEDWAQVHRTLAVLTLFHQDVKTESWNRLLQGHAKAANPGRVTQVLQDMMANDVQIQGVTIEVIMGMLRRRQRGRQPVTIRNGHFDDVRFVARTLITILESGVGYVSPLKWREILRRFGMMGRLRELRRLSHWLLRWYAIPGDKKFAHLQHSQFHEAATAKLRAQHRDPNLYFNLTPRLSQSHPQHPLRQLFGPAWQRTLIIWGFHHGWLPNSPLERFLLSGPTRTPRHRRRLQWSFGLRALVELRDAGLLVYKDVVANACSRQLGLLFGHRRSLTVTNRIVKRRNTIPYSRYVKEINEIWGEKILGMEDVRFTHPVIFGDGGGVKSSGAGASGSSNRKEKEKEKESKERGRHRESLKAVKLLERRHFERDKGLL